MRLLVLLALLAVVAAGSYWKIPAAREAVDEKVPIVKETLVRFGAAPGGGVGADGSPQAAPAPPVDQGTLFQTLAADPNSWPNTVHLLKAVEFPAVSGGREVGKALLKAGTEVKLRRIQNGALGLEYQGGGAWVKPGDTDFIERARAPVSQPMPSNPAPL